MTLPSLIVADVHVIIMGRVFHETFVNFITFKVKILTSFVEKLVRSRKTDIGQT